MTLKDSELGNKQIQEFKSYSHIYHQISLPLFFVSWPIGVKRYEEFDRRKYSTKSIITWSWQ